MPEKADKSCIVLTVDKGMAMVMMDRKNYINKAKSLLEHLNTYRLIPTDPISKQKAKLNNISKRIKAETGMDEITNKKMYPTGASSPKFYGLPNP